MAKAVRNVVVSAKQSLTPNLTRMVLQGDALSDFPSGFEGGYVKLAFPQQDSKDILRSYTIRAFDPSEQALTLEMVAHGDTGPAATWANHVATGSQINILGPGACQKINTDADWFLLAGDMSAIPAISVNLEQLPADATGAVVLEVISEADKLELPVPPGIDIHWIINPIPEAENSMLEDTVMNLPWREGQPSVWVAGEFSASRALRQYFRHERKVPRENMYVSCYWKIGDTDEGMKQAKRNDTEAW